MGTISHNSPCISNEDISAVVDCLRSGFIGNGLVAESLEYSFSKYMKGGYSCATNSGTSALYLALKCGGVLPGKKVIVPTYACTALLDAIFLLGAKPIICDVGLDSFNIDRSSLEVALKDPDAHAVILVHTFGRSILKSNLPDLSDYHVVEDCCHSLGAMTEDSIGDVSIYSFYPTKVIAGGEGGLLWSRNNQIIKEAKTFISPVRINYEPRFNLRMSDLTASLVSSQLKKIGDLLQRRNYIAYRYINSFKKSEIQAKIIPLGSEDICYRFVLIFPDNQKRESVFNYLFANDIEVSKLFSPNELLHNYLNLKKENYPNAENIASTSLSIPCQPALNDSNVDRICEVITSFNQ
jgi:dTDP-4-amino-4,6-dideoxygalactose transaminase